ncbi:hypothetical protein PG997_014558 [Apiospora hydei]|uniref:Transcription factor domain-containing protein n=1 Tax=Apiospora hydei TaxID=1337664 RepID=A0ABR1UU55_9PEZI
MASNAGDSLSPAPYGHACVGCSRAKCKCFLGSMGLNASECVPARVARKRKADSPPQQHQQQPQPPPYVSGRLEEKLDSLLSILRSHSAEKQTQALAQDAHLQTHTPNSQSESTPTSQADGTLRSRADCTPVGDPDLVLDTVNSIIHALRPSSPEHSLSPIHNDVSVHYIPEQRATDQLEMFRRSFIPMFPFVHIQDTMSASDLLREKPFLWLVMMCLATTNVAEQFAMEDTIWHIISRRIVTQHLASLDLLLGVICYGAWSHYFKKDKPFMTMIAQLAVSLAFEMGLHHDPPISKHRIGSNRIIVRDAPSQEKRTLEERRTILGVFHLTSAAWSSHRKIQVLSWTPYMANSLRILGESGESDWDYLLATQVKCQIITNQLTCSPKDHPVESAESSKSASTMLVTYLLQQLNEIRQTLPPRLHTNRCAKYYLYNAELKVRESILARLNHQQEPGPTQFRTLQDLDSLLTCAESWLKVWLEMPLMDWLGITVDTFAQFTHFVIVLFKLTILDEPGWDMEEVRRRADVFAILDRSCEIVDNIPTAVGMKDIEEGSRRGLFFKTADLFRAIKALIMAEMGPDVLGNAGLLQPPHSNAAKDYGIAGSIEFDQEYPSWDGAMLNISDDPWLLDIWGSSWDSLPEDSFNLSFPDI